MYVFKGIEQLLHAVRKQVEMSEHRMTRKLSVAEKNQVTGEVRAYKHVLDMMTDFSAQHKVTEKVVEQFDPNV